MYVARTRRPPQRWNLDRRGQIKRRYDRRCYYLCGERGSRRIGRACVRQVTCRVGTCDAYDQRREGLRVWRRIQRRLLPRIGKERSLFNDNGHINTRTNNSGGIQGGISNGQDIYFRVAFKSVATILMEQETVNQEGEDTILKARGRHDPCVLPRAVPIVESMTAMTLLDYLLIQKTRENF